MISLTSPVETRAHHWPASAKLLGLCLASFALFQLQSPALHALVLSLVLLLYALPGRVFCHAGLRGLKMLWPFVVLLLLWHALSGDLTNGAVIVMRMLSAVGLANLVTMTTRLSDMMAAFRPLLAPLQRLGLNWRGLELAIALVIRMIPVLQQHAAQLGEAWRARAMRRASWRIILPFTMQAMNDADHVAEALRARGGTDGAKGS